MQENYRKDMTLKEAEVMALSTLKEVMEEKVMPLAWYLLIPINPLAFFFPLLH